MQKLEQVFVSLTEEFGLTYGVPYKHYRITPDDLRAAMIYNAAQQAGMVTETMRTALEEPPVEPPQEGDEYDRFAGSERWQLEYGNVRHDGELTEESIDVYANVEDIFFGKRTFLMSLHRLPPGTEFHRKRALVGNQGRDVYFLSTEPEGDLVLQEGARAAEYREATQSYRSWLKERRYLQEETAFFSQEAGVKVLRDFFHRFTQETAPV